MKTLVQPPEVTQDALYLPTDASPSKFSRLSGACAKRPETQSMI